MKPWAEDNYLERLMPQLRQANRVRMESCPDSDLLTAFTEDQLTPFVRGAITTHLAQCPECSEICARLVSFSRATVPAHDPEWPNAEKRLENWKDSFLEARAAANRPKSGPESVRVLQLQDLPKKAFFGRLQWALGAVAALIIVAGAVAIKKGMFVPGPVPVADRQSPALASPQPANSAQPSLPENNVVSSQTASSQTSQPQTSQPGEHDLIASTTQPKTVTNPNQPKVPSLPNTHRSTLAPDLKKGEKPKKEEKKDDKDIKAENPPETETAHDYTPPDFTPNDRILTGSDQASAPSIPASMARASAGAHAARATSPNTTAVPANKSAKIPASVQLDAGSRLWIQVNSINHQTDGSFTFHGSLLQPSDSKGAQLLDKGTELAGSGTNKDGKVTVAVSGFSIQGVPYTLPAKTASGTPAPGTGKAVPFQNGQVLEMWVSSASTYEKAAVGTSIGPKQ